jgi:MFS family permease
MRQFMEPQAVFALVILCGEVPSGLLSDLWGRKKTLLLGSTLKAISSVGNISTLRQAAVAPSVVPRRLEFERDAAVAPQSQALLREGRTQYIAAERVSEELF